MVPFPGSRLSRMLHINVDSNDDLTTTACVQLKSGLPPGQQAVSEGTFCPSLLLCTQDMARVLARFSTQA
jgi:hypothetical protein